MAQKLSDISLIAHELQAPLIMLKSRLEAALHSPWCRNEALELVRASIREIETMNRMVVDLLLLELTRSEAYPREPCRLEVAEMARTVCRRIHPLAAEREIALETRLEGPLFIQGNSDQLQRVLINVVDNAIKYTQPGGRVSVEGRLLDDRVVIEVRDTGCGIPRDALPHVFEPFYQVDKARDREAGGTGLGLALVRALVENSGGTVEVESVQGEGTRIILCFAVPRS
jgi:two-component system phosphate regulon sensor histidine kinase PhoR